MGDSVSNPYDELLADFADLGHRFQRRRPVPPTELQQLSHGEAYVLMMVFRSAEEGHTLRPSDIARFACTTPSATSQMLRSLEDRGYVLRERDQADSRSVSVRLTERGQELSHDLTSRRRALFSQLVDEIGEDELRSFLATAHRIVALIESSEGFEACEDPRSACRGGRR